MSLVPRAWTSRFSGLARLARPQRELGFAHSQGLDAQSFDPPHGGRLIENYVVEYELRTPAGARYKSSFAVYIYDDRGRGLYLLKEPYLTPEVSSTVAEAIDCLSDSEAVDVFDQCRLVFEYVFSRLRPQIQERRKFHLDLERLASRQRAWPQKAEEPLPFDIARRA